MTADFVARSSAAVTARMSYVVLSQHTPRSYVSDPPPGVPWETAQFDERPVEIIDGRGLDCAGSVDREGYALFDAPSAVSDFADRDAVTSTYYAECVELALAATGAVRGVVFDHLLRKRQVGAALDFGRSSSGRAGVNARIHNDYTESSGSRRLALVLGDELERAAVSRFGIVNVWRSSRGPILDTPLAVCDARTVTREDLVEAEVVYPSRMGEIYFVTYSANHRWRYFSAMDRHEALVFKQFDSACGVARFTPHAAFEHPHAPPGAPPRESIEVRCLVVYD